MEPSPRLRLALPLVACCVGWAACSDAPAPPPGPVQFRASGDVFQIDRRDGKGWQRFFVAGVNLAIAKPGYFPAELPATREDYLRWFDGISAMNANTIRIYTLHFPLFYTTFREWNLAHGDDPLYLVQGVWLDEIETCATPDGCDYITDRTAQLEQEVTYVIDAVHGHAKILARQGKAWGDFQADVSPWVMAMLPGHEMDGHFVKVSNALYAGYDTYAGRYVRMQKGTPIEGWVAHALDFVAAYEWERYGQMRPVGWSNWPALDPIHHPTEPATFLQDTVDCDFGKFETVPPFDRGIFVSYHVYPFNPEFIIHDPGYKQTTSATGQVNSYLGYLKDLKDHHKGVPLLVAEFGIPSSFGVAHVNLSAYNHGGYNEAEQADIVVDQVQSCREAGAAGVVVFEWIDEWFKRTWTCTPTMVPPERGPFWYDVISPEESFGILSYYPVPGRSRRIDGLPGDWAAPGTFVVAEQQGIPLSPAGDGWDLHRTLVGAWLAADPAFLFLRLALATDTVPSLDEVVLLVGLSTIEGQTGDRRMSLLPELQTAKDLGFESWLLIDKKAGILEVWTDDLYDPTPRLNGLTKQGGIPAGNDNGQFVLGAQLVNNDAQYIAEGKPVTPEKKFYARGKLRLGDARLDTLAHLWPGDGGELEVRLPWHALWVTDPSTRKVLYDDPATKDVFDAQSTAGVQVVVLAAKRLADGSLKIVDALPRGVWNGEPIAAAWLPTFAWEPWEHIVVEERNKPLYTSLQALFATEL